jgi:cobalt/nickel transport system ATP-binding protein
MPLEPRQLPAIRRKIGMVFQDSENQLFMPTVLDDVTFGPLNNGMTPDEAGRRARSALASVAMEAAAGRAPYHLSAGEKEPPLPALAMDPGDLVLDERLLRSIP